MRSRVFPSTKSRFYPALTGSKIPPQNSAKAKKLGGESTARKSPIGSTNNQWGMNTPTD
ncbi:hypothetical protein COI87_09420 [Bacillus thuringiensis]|nr:hypothetical protein CN473_07945 [Bacillus thuringiensis]PEY76717.1 hypothetical protein CN355_01650 [Bacillus thuringiensis]PFJ12470.1 hypothetical protein COI87_09420 [Bacillus thuringiensis]PFV29836.1 hypothetical protein COL01_23270 [Bacillus thuringiensis]PFW27635.1 hypothetical protein COL19_04155 [Bacillus thuringiensis]